MKKDRLHMHFSPCPSCGCIPEGVVDMVPGVAGITRNPDPVSGGTRLSTWQGQHDWVGETRMTWDGTASLAQHGQRVLWCQGCIIEYPNQEDPKIPRWVARMVDAVTRLCRRYGITIHEVV